MNKQGKIVDGVLVSRGIEWCHIFGICTGFTVNPIRGCEHRCRWRMPDGKIVVCYAETGHDRLNGPGSFQNITYHPDMFDSIRSRKQPAGIFIDSTSDLFGRKVAEEHIVEVIKVMAECDRHIFFTLTKNPRRLLDFEFPDNVLVGMSAPPTFMFGKEMTSDQQRTWFCKGVEWLAGCQAKNKWLSLEPLAIDVSTSVAQVRDRICWAVVGAGSDGAKVYQPDKVVFANTMDALGDTPVFFKGNLNKDLANVVAGRWREEYPPLSRFKKQQELI